MSEETLQAGQTDTVTGVGTVTTDDGMQQTVTGDPVVAPVVDPAAPVVDSVTPVVDPVVADPAAPVDATTPEVPVTGPVAPVVPAVTPEAPAEQVVIMYNGKAIVRKIGLFDADGAQECELSDGTTAFVPKSVLGE